MMDSNFDCIDPNLLQLLDDDDVSVPLHSNDKQVPTLERSVTSKSKKSKAVRLVFQIKEVIFFPGNLGSDVTWSYTDALIEAPVITVSSDVAPSFTIPIAEQAYSKAKR